MVEESSELDKNITYMPFIDFEKAFDPVDRNILGKLLNYHGVPDKLVKMIMSL